MCTRRAHARAAPAAWPAAARLNSVCRCCSMHVCVSPGPVPLLAAASCFAPGMGAPASARAHDRGGCRALGSVHTRARVRRRYAALERRLGEVDRARAILVHASALADPRVNAQFWADWNDFEARPRPARPCHGGPGADRRIAMPPCAAARQRVGPAACVSGAGRPGARAGRTGPGGAPSPGRRRAGGARQRGHIPRDAAHPALGGGLVLADALQHRGRRGRRRARAGHRCAACGVAPRCTWVASKAGQDAARRVRQGLALLGRTRCAALRSAHAVCAGDLFCVTGHRDNSCCARGSDDGGRVRRGGRPGARR